MKAQFSDKFKAAAKAANIPPEKLAKAIRGLLAPSKCRDTTKLFNANILEAISCAV